MKVILYMASTANGLIASEKDNVEWVSGGSWKSYMDKMKASQTVIIGKRTYGQMKPEEFLPKTRLRGSQFVAAEKLTPSFSKRP